MPTVESTPEFVQSAYKKMEDNLKVVRQRIRKPLTLSDKILLSHLDDPAGAELVSGESYILRTGQRDPILAAPPWAAKDWRRSTHHSGPWAGSPAGAPPGSSGSRPATPWSPLGSIFHSPREPRE